MTTLSRPSHLLALAVTAAVGILVAPPAHSAVTLSAGESATFNFDFVAASANPTPSYTSVWLTFGWADTDAGDWYTSSLYAGLNGTGGTLTTQNLSAGLLVGFDVADFDGKFSLLVTATQGSFSIAPYAYALNEAGAQTENVYGVPANGTVPAPATLALLGIGLAGLGVAKRRKAQ